MLEAARQALCELGIVGRGDPMPPFTARMSGNLSFLVYPPGPDFYLVKIGLLHDLRREFDGLAAGHSAFPNSVPRPLAWSPYRSFPTLVATGIPHTPLGPLTMRTPGRALEHALASYFGSASAAFAIAGAMSHSQRLAQALERLRSPLPEAWTQYVGAIAKEVDLLAPVRQHGDFYVNNLGMRDDALVIFDWEDFGREYLPGLDLALLLLSLNEFSPSRTRANTLWGGPYSWILNATLAGIGVSHSLFFRLLPAYLALVASMKAELGYSASLSARAAAAVPQAIEDVNFGHSPTCSGNRA